MKVSQRNYTLIVRCGIMLLAAFLIIGIFQPQWLQLLFINKKATFSVLGIIFFCYTAALCYSVAKKEMTLSAKIMQLIRAPLYLFISIFCFYYAYSYL